jgi:L-methionine (R)-S-oxide reductase
MEGVMAPFGALVDRVAGIVDGPLGRDDKLQAICRALWERVPHYDWVGFYLVDGDARELVLGPFEGEPTEHVRIPFGRGICGRVAVSKAPLIIQDISKETNYLACSLKVRSEIVVPIFRAGEMVAELDVDSHATSPFTDEDREFLENVGRIVSRLF